MKRSASLSLHSKFPNSHKLSQRLTSNPEDPAIKSQVGMLQELVRLNKRIKPRGNTVAYSPQTQDVKFFRNSGQKQYKAQLTRSKVSSPTGPIAMHRKFFSSTQLLNGVKGLSVGLLNLRGMEQLKLSANETKRLLISDGLMRKSGDFNRRYIRRLSDVISTSTHMSPRKKGNTPKTDRIKISAFGL